MRKHHVDIDGVRYPRNGVNVEYGSSDYVDQYRDLKLFFKENVGGELVNPFKSYPDMKKKIPFHFIDLTFQVNQVNPKKMGLFEEYKGSTKNARLFIILIRHKEIKLMSDGDKVTEVTVI